MSRLIDADRFKRFLQALCKAGAPYDEVVQLLDKEPTAYDKEKVVAEIRKQPFGNYGVQEEGEIIDIVRKGGVE